MEARSCLRKLLAAVTRAGEKDARMRAFERVLCYVARHRHLLDAAFHRRLRRKMRRLARCYPEWGRLNQEHKRLYGCDLNYRPAPLNSV